jgi:hypothetical protein
MEVIIDRFEGDYAVVEMADRTMVNLPRVLLPEAREGDVVAITVSAAKSAHRRRQVENLMKDVWSD